MTLALTSPELAIPDLDTTTLVLLPAVVVVLAVPVVVVVLEPPVVVEPLLVPVPVVVLPFPAVPVLALLFGVVV